MFIDYASKYFRTVNSETMATVFQLMQEIPVEETVNDIAETIDIAKIPTPSEINRYLGFLDNDTEWNLGCASVLQNVPKSLSDAGKSLVRNCTAFANGLKLLTNNQWKLQNQVNTIFWNIRNLRLLLHQENGRIGHQCVADLMTVLDAMLDEELWSLKCACLKSIRHKDNVL